MHLAQSHRFLLRPPAPSAKGKAKPNGPSDRSALAACRALPKRCARQQKAAAVWNANTESGQTFPAEARRKVASAAKRKRVSVIYLYLF